MRYFFTMLRAIKQKIEHEIFHYNRKRISGTISYSQCGEDLIVQYIFTLRGIAKPSYLDIGAHHPLALSNTALFYKKGCRGINIEANPNLIKYFKRLRPKDISINVGVGAVESVMSFYIMEDSTLSTFSEPESTKMIAAGKKLREIIKVPVLPINNVIQKYSHGQFPDFLSLDVEGIDFEILKGIQFNSSYPKIICVEAAEYSPIGAGRRKTEIIDFLQSKGYFEYANTNLNAIMVKNEFWFI